MQVVPFGVVVRRLGAGTVRHASLGNREAGVFGLLFSPLLGKLLGIGAFLRGELGWGKDVLARVPAKGGVEEGAWLGQPPPSVALDEPQDVLEHRFGSLEVDLHGQADAVKLASRLSFLGAHDVGSEEFPRAGVLGVADVCTHELRAFPPVFDSEFVRR
jgi:hypothetical protein